MFNGLKVAKLKKEIEGKVEVIKGLEEHVRTLKQDILNKAEKIASMSSAYELQYAQALKTVELDHRKAQMDLQSSLEAQHKAKIEEIQNSYQAKLLELNEQHFEKLKESLVKLHEEGNATSKFMEKTTLKMMDVVTQVGQRTVPVLEEPQETVKKRR